MFVFLDIDGTLRRESAPKYQAERDLVERFELWVREQEEQHGSVEIVISSNWKDAFSLDEIRQKIGSAYLWTRTTGVTPTLVGDASYPRHAEIQEYLESAGAIDAHWVAIDDTAGLYPPNLENLILVNPEEGFQP